jgi:hypothetical protein
MGLAPSIRGGLADHPAAPAFALEVLRVHVRYAELVARLRLCPFLRDVESGLGAFCVMLEGEPDVGRVVAFVRESGRDVGHIVYPLARPAPTVFERFSNAVSERLREELDMNRPVLAAFHPDLIGDASAPHRLIGLLRRAPDPFVQFVPAGLHEGGTVLAGVARPPPADPAESNFAKLKGPRLDELIAELADIRADRDRSYAPFLAELGA